MSFELHPNLARKIFIYDLPLCRVLMEDESHYPWLFLVPRKNGCSKLIDLTIEEQMQLMKELNFIQKVLWEEFQPTQLNVAAIGNKTPQLHVHVIARFSNDPAWPGTVWDHPIRMPLEEKQKNARITLLQRKYTATSLILENFTRR